MTYISFSLKPKQKIQKNKKYMKQFIEKVAYILNSTNKKIFENIDPNNMNKKLNT